MKKISKIKIGEKYRTIPKGFELDILNFTMITGENNTGKTNFVKAIVEGKASFFTADGSDVTGSVEVIYIPAEGVKGDEELKIGKTSTVVEAVKSLVAGDPVFKLDTDDKNSVKEVEKLTKSVNAKINEMFGKKGTPDNSINISIKKEIDLKEFLAQVVYLEPSDYSTGEQRKHDKFEELGQGIQRIIIAAFILSAAEANSNKDKIRLILLEEPEIYLHPRLKKSLNGMLKGIAVEENYQVIVTTHDPYLAITNLGVEGNSNFSFSRSKSGDTEAVPNTVIGVEDELLHILLFNKAFEVSKMSDLAAFGSHLESKVSAPTKKYFRQDGKTENIALPLYIRHQLHHPENKNTIAGKNKYSDVDLIKSTEILHRVL